MSKTKQAKRKHPNQGLIDCFLGQAKAEEVYTKDCVEQGVYYLAYLSQCRRAVWLQAARLTEELS